MFQNFDNPSEGAHSPARIAKLRAKMAQSNIDGFVIPLADAHQGEYVADCDARLAWATGFTGSAGFAVVLADKAAIFVDGRYTVQARAQVDLDIFDQVDWPATRLEPWIKANMPKGTLHLDPWLHTVQEVDALRKALADHPVEIAFGENLVDAIWDDRPAAPRGEVRIQDIAYAGVAHDTKRKDLAATLGDSAAAAMTLTDSVCWLLNIRGSDIPCNPIVQAFALLHRDGSVDLCCDAPLSDELRAHLGAEIRIHSKADFLPLATQIDGPVVIDTASAPEALRAALKTPILGTDPCIMPKACKNAAEIAGTRAAHLRDGAAMVNFLCWLDAQPVGSVTEISAAQKLENCRHATGVLRDISFDTISGAGPNAAMAHYRVNTQSDRTLEGGELFLIDSGGQYEDGTTDITRTIAVGAPQSRHKPFYTRVLQGVIAIHRIRFPRSITGGHLDALARAQLWMAGLDFDHGTGHGVGSYLCVHEGPQRISGISNVALREGMILSNEPGYYREGDFGIRIENLIVTRKAPELPGQDARDWLDFENLTWVPFDRRLIDVALLSAEELEWIDTYHQNTLARISPLLGETERAWLEAACAPLRA